MAVDPRAALVLFVGMIVCATFLHTPAGLVVCCAVSVVLALCSGAAARTLGEGVLIASTLTAVAMLPAVTSAVTPGRPVFHALSVAVTAQGLRVAAILVLRTAACLTLGIGLFASNPPEELFAALRWFRIPGVFVAVLLVTYRYLQAIARAALEDHVARRSRVADEADLSASRRWAGERIGSLWNRSRDLGEEVHLGMISRGFDGVWVPRRTTRIGAVDICWIALCAVICAGLLALDRRLMQP